MRKEVEKLLIKAAEAIEGSYMTKEDSYATYNRGCQKYEFNWFNSKEGRTDAWDETWSDGYRRVDYAGKDWLLINNDGSGVVADGNWDENAIEDLEAELEYQQESDD
jgi:hypothetical protein